RQPGVGLIDRFRNLVGVDFDREYDLRARFPLGVHLYGRHGDLRYQFGLIPTTSKWSRPLHFPPPLGKVGVFSASPVVLGEIDGSLHVGMDRALVGVRPWSSEGHHEGVSGLLQAGVEAA